MLKNPLMEQLRKCIRETISDKSKGYLEFIIMDIMMDKYKPKHYKVIFKIWKQL